jgi:hypothetical protein
MDAWKTEAPFGELVWTPAPNPWRVLRRVAAWATVIGILAGAMWSELQHMPTIAFTPAGTAPIEPVVDKPVVAVENALAPEKPVVATSAPRADPVIRTIAGD